MKLQHYAIIFLIIIIPLSIVCRSVINKKMLLLRDETKYNNILDNATYDAVSQIKEVADLTKLGKNVPLTENVMEAAIDRFFNTLCVNFNLPANRKTAESYFDRYIPAIIIIGYDGLYVYSCENTATGYQFKLKPKIPYSCYYGGVYINFTLDNYVKILFPNKKFAVGFPLDDTGFAGGTHLLGGYVGQNIDFDNNGESDLNGVRTAAGVVPGTNPYGIPETNDHRYDNLSGTGHGQEFVLNNLATYITTSSDNEGNLSYYLYALRQVGINLNSDLMNLFVYGDRSYNGTPNGWDR